MPELDLTDCRDPRLAQVRVLAVMHAPGNPDLRRRCELIWQRRQAPASDDDDRTILTGAWQHLVRELRRAVSRRDGFHKGNVAATILVETLRARATVEKAMEAIRTEGVTMGRTGLSHGSLERAWNEFRFVAHLWAAFLSLGLIPAFAKPLLIADMLDVFSVAEALRGKGERYATGNQQRPLLDPEMTWRFRFPADTVLDGPERFPALSSLPA